MLVRLRRLLLVGVVMLALAAGLLFSLSPPVYADIEVMLPSQPGEKYFDTIPLRGPLNSERKEADSDPPSAEPIVFRGEFITVVIGCVCTTPGDS